MQKVINGKTSTAIDSLRVDPSAGTAETIFSNGRKYLYTNVNVDAIYDLLKNGSDSFGQWVNANLVGKKGVDYTELAQDYIPLLFLSLCINRG